jgi:hypothetical protein
MLVRVMLGIEPLSRPGHGSTHRTFMTPMRVMVTPSVTDALASPRLGRSAWTA